MGATCIRTGGTTKKELQKCSSFLFIYPYILFYIPYILLYTPPLIYSDNHPSAPLSLLIIHMFRNTTILL